MLTPIARGIPRILRSGVACVLGCALLFFLFEGGPAVFVGDFPTAVAAKKKIIKKRGKVRPGLVRKLKHRRLGAVNFPPLRDGSASAPVLAGFAPPRPTASSPPLGPPPVAPPPSPVMQPKPGQTSLVAKKPCKGAKCKPPPQSDTEILDEAQNAYVLGERQKAIDMALGVAEKNGPTATTAWRFIGLAACSVRSHRIATRAYQNLSSPADQKSITNACKVNGLQYRDEQFVRE